MHWSEKSGVLYHSSAIYASSFAKRNPDRCLGYTLVEFSKLIKPKKSFLFILSNLITIFETFFYTEVFAER